MRKNFNRDFLKLVKKIILKIILNKINHWIHMIFRKYALHIIAKIFELNKII